MSKYLKRKIKLLCKYRNWQALKELLESIYHQIVPFDYRPKQIYYNIKGWFKPHWKIRPRDITWNTWVDKCHLLPSMMFEITTQFLEKECNPGIVDWDCDFPGNFHEFRGERRKVIDLMREAVDWWQSNHYCNEYEADKEIYDQISNTKNDKEKAKLYRQLWDNEIKREKEKKEYMHLLVDLHGRMWT